MYLNVAPILAFGVLIFTSSILRRFNRGIRAPLSDPGAIIGWSDAGKRLVSLVVSASYVCVTIITVHVIEFQGLGDGVTFLVLGGAAMLALSGTLQFIGIKVDADPRALDVFPLLLSPVTVPLLTMWLLSLST